MDIHAAQILEKTRDGTAILPCTDGRRRSPDDVQIESTIETDQGSGGPCD